MERSMYIQCLGRLHFAANGEGRGPKNLRRTEAGNSRLTGGVVRCRSTLRWRTTDGLGWTEAWHLGVRAALPVVFRPDCKSASLLLGAWETPNWR